MNNATNNLYSLSWNNHTRNLKSAFDVFRCDNELVDVTLSCEGKKIKAHKIVLSACSLYFLDLFRDNPCQHPIIILRDIKYQNMVDILNFMYQGEVNVAYEHLGSFLKTAELLQIKGLVEDNPSKECEYISTNSSDKEHKINERKNCTPKLDTKNVSVSQNFNNTDASLQVTNTELNNKDDELMCMDVLPESNLLKSELLKSESFHDDNISENNSSEYIDTNLPDDNNISLLDPENMSSPQNYDESFQTNNKDQCFPCQYCDKIFSHPNSLKLHLPRHSGRTSCRLCQAVLSRKYELKVHMRKKHNIELH